MIDLTDYKIYLRREERSVNTIEKYIRDLKAFFSFLGNRELCKEVVVKEKPAKRGESIADKAIWAVLAAVIAFVLGRMGL